MKEHFAEQLEHLRRRLILYGAEVEKQIARGRGGADGRLGDQGARRRRRRRADRSNRGRNRRGSDPALRPAAAGRGRPAAPDRRAARSTTISSGSATTPSTSPRGAERIAWRRNPSSRFVDLPHMAEIAMAMLKNALDSFVNRDTALAQRGHPEGRRSRRKEPVDHPRAADLHGGNALADLLLPGTDLGLEEPRAGRRSRDEHRGGHDLHCAGEGRETPRGRDRVRFQIAGKGCSAPLAFLERDEPAHAARPGPPARSSRSPNRLRPEHANLTRTSRRLRRRRAFEEFAAPGTSRPTGFRSPAEEISTAQLAAAADSIARSSSGSRGASGRTPNFFGRSKCVRMSKNPVPAAFASRR